MATAPPLPSLNYPGVAGIPGKGNGWYGTKRRGPHIQRVRMLGGASGVDRHGVARDFFLARTPVWDLLGRGTPQELEDPYSSS